MRLSRKTIEEINRHTSPNSLLIVSHYGLFRLKTPFKVLCIVDGSGLAKGTIHTVSAVKTTINNELIYQIGDKYYLYRYFVILVDL